MSSLVVQRRDTRQALRWGHARHSDPFLEARKAANVAAMRLGVGCWVRVSSTGLVVHVATPESSPQVGTPYWDPRGYGWWTCYWPGCPARWSRHMLDLEPAQANNTDWPDRMRRHLLEPHDLCTCGRFFHGGGWTRHRGQVRRYGTSHPPFVRLQLRTLQPSGDARG